MARFTISPHVIYIQARHDVEKQWLTTQYKLTDEDIDAIIDERLVEWKILVSIEELLDTEVGPLEDIPVEQDKVKEFKEESSMTPIYSNMERKLEEGRPKIPFEQGEASNTPMSVKKK